MQVLRMYWADLGGSQGIVLCFQKHNALCVDVGYNMQTLFSVDTEISSLSFFNFESEEKGNKGHWLLHLFSEICSLNLSHFIPPFTTFWSL